MTSKKPYRKRDPKRFPLLTIIMLILLFLVTLAAMLLGGIPERAVLGTMLIGVTTIIIVISILLKKQNKIDLSVQMLIAAFLFMILPIPFIINGMGIVLLVAAIVVTSGVAAETLSIRASRHAITTSFLVGVIVLLLDLYLPADRPNSPYPIVTNGIITLFILLFGYLVIRNFSRFSLRAKFVMTFLVIALIPLGLAGYINIRSTRNILIDQANQSLMTASVETAAKIDNFINLNLNTVSTEAQFSEFSEFLNLSYDERKQSYLHNDVEMKLHSFRRRDLVFILSYALLDRDGINLLDTQEINIGKNESYRDYFREILRTQGPFVSQVQYTDNNVYSGALFFSAPIHSEGEIIGVLRVKFNAAILQDILLQSSNRAGKQSYGILLDDNYIVLGHGTNSNWIARSIVPFEPSRYAELRAQGRLPDLPFERRSLNLEDVETGIKSASDNYTFSSTPNDSFAITGSVTKLESLPWLMVFVQNQDVFLAPVEEQTRTAILLALFIAGVVSISALAISQLLSGPITRLTGIAEIVGAGDLTAKAQIETDDEIGLLAATFNQTTSQLHEVINLLEQRVKERTKAVETSAKVSRRLSTILDQHELVGEVVEQIKNAFTFYHVHIYLLSSDKQHLIMSGGTGQAGKKMLAQDHKISWGKGLVGKSAAKNSTVLVPDVTQDPNWLPNPLLPDTKSEMAVPISVGGEVLGVLDIQHNQIDGLNQDHVMLTESIANQVAIALQNAKQFRATQSLLTETEALYAITRSTTHSIDLDSMLSETLQKVLDSTGLDAGLITTLNETDNKLIVNVHYRLPDQMISKMSANGLEGTLCDLVYKNKENIIIDDLSIDPPIDVSGLIGLGYRSYIGVPLRSREKILGTLCAFGKSSKSDQPSTLSIMQAAGNQIGVAIENVKLFQQTQKRTEELSVLNEMGKTLTSLKDINAIYETLYEYTSRLMNTENFFLAIFDRDRQMLHFPITYNEGIRINVPPRVLGKGLSDHIIRSHKSILFSENVMEGMDALGIDFVPIGDDRPALSWLGVPLIFGDQILGVLVLQSITTPGLYKEHDHDLLTAIASQVAIAIENAQTLLKTQKQADLEALINTISQRIQNTTTIENALQVAVREIGRALNAEQTRVQLNIKHKVKSDTDSNGNK